MAAELLELQVNDVCNGNLFEEMEMHFKQMVQEVMHNEKPGVLVAKIKVGPPHKIEGVPNLPCDISYDVTHKVTQARPVYTLLVDKYNRAVKVGTDTDDALNETLPLTVDDGHGNEIPIGKKKAEIKIS